MIWKKLVYVRLLLWRLGIAMLLFSLCRVLFLLFNNPLLPEVQVGAMVRLFVAGWRFDLSALIYVNMLVILGHLVPLPIRHRQGYQRLIAGLFFTCNGLAIAMELMDIRYFRFALQRSTSNVGDISGDFFQLLPQFLRDFWYLPLIFIGLMAIAGLLYRWTNRCSQHPNPAYHIEVPAFFLVGLFVFIAARGGTQLIPVMPITAVEYVEDTRLAPLVNNTTLHFIHSFQQRTIQEPTWWTPNELNQQFTHHQTFNFSDSMRRDNVMIIMLESFSKEYLGYGNSYAGDTPFLDSLIGQGLYFNDGFANGGRSNQAMVAVTTSIPALMADPLMISRYQGNRLRGLAEILSGLGYRTVFFHGGNNGTFNFDSFARAAGFQDYFGRREYGLESDYDGNWGVFDRPFFLRTIDEINQLEAPFFTMLFSLTSHHPYTVEADFEALHPTLEPLRRSVRYTDDALRQFFEKAQQQAWHERTLYVLVADHVGTIRYAENATPIGYYQIPILFYKADGSLRGHIADIAQQIDIMPSVLDYLHYSGDFMGFGQSIFDTTTTRYAYTYANNIYQILDKQYVLHFDGTQSIRLFDYQKDQQLQNNLLTKRPIIRNRLEHQLRAVIQTHHSAMISNDLY